MLQIQHQTRHDIQKQKFLFLFNVFRSIIPIQIHAGKTNTIGKTFPVLLMKHLISEEILKVHFIVFLSI